MNIDTNYKEQDKSLVIYVNGNFCINQIKSFAESYSTYHVPIASYCINLMNTTNIDSSALSAILKLNEIAKENEATIQIVIKEDSKVHKILTLSNFEHIIEIVKIAG